MRGECSHLWDDFQCGLSQFGKVRDLPSVSESLVARSWSEVEFVMASRGPGGRLAEVLLIAALVVVALLTHPASSGWLFSPAPKPIVYPTRCGAKYTANWTNIIRIAAYGGGGGVYAPPVAEGEGGEAAPGAGVFHNSFIGSTSNPGTNVDYLVEAHPTYLNIGEENLESNYAVVGGDNSSAVNRYLDQVVTLEYLDNTKTIYITIYHLVKPSETDEVFKYTHSVYFHRFYCDEKTKPTAENVYNELFPTIDKHLWRDRCKKGGKITGGDLYEPNRKKFIEKVVSDACSVDEKTSKVKPLIFNLCIT